MAEIIEALNNTSEERAVFYVIAFIIALAIVVGGTASIVKYLRK